MNRYDLDGQVAVVTGGAQGIGYAVARRLYDSGATVHLWDMDGALAADSAAQLGERAHGAAVDVTDAAGVEAAARATAAVQGRIDVLTCRAVLPVMAANGYGRVVNIASVAGKEGNPNAGAYSASKAAVIALTKTLGKEFAGQDIAVNCVTPAAARTRIFDQMSQAHIDFMLSKIPRGRFLEVDEAANMIAWLCTKENSFTTGAVFDLSGGRATY
ncbi:MAG: SDR family oxidoreductase [Rhodobacteraceae bacterium]|nr:SDR family oxidoreductase [Paracoccaceae bacterium]